MVTVISLSWEEEKKLEDEMYEKFLALRFDEDVSVMEMYNILGLRYESSMARRLRKRFRLDGYNVGRKKSKLRDDDCMYIYELNDGFVITKTDRSRKNHYYGQYKDLDLAKKVRDKLVECDWDKNCLKDILDKLGVN